MLRLAHLTSLASLAALVAGAVILVACGDQSSNAAPIIDSVEAPPVVTEQNGTYTIPVTMLFHDNDSEAITRVHYTLSPNIDGVVDVPVPNPDAQSAEVTIVIKAADLDGTPAQNVAVKGQPSAPGSQAAQDAAKAEDDRAHGRGQDRNRARALELRIVDGRGAESLPLSSTVTLD